LRAGWEARGVDRVERDRQRAGQAGELPAQERLGRLPDAAASAAAGAASARAAALAGGAGSSMVPSRASRKRARESDCMMLAL